MQRITGVKYPVSIDGVDYVAAWSSPHSVRLFERQTRKLAAHYTPKISRGTVPFDRIAAASDGAKSFRLTGW